MSYQQFKDEDGDTYGSFETFEHPADYDLNTDLAEGEEPRGPGWYWWACSPAARPKGSAAWGVGRPRTMAKRDSDLTNQRRCTAQAALAVAAMGGKFYDALGVDYGTEAASFFEHTRDWSGVRGAVVATYEEAKELGAYLVERPLLGGPRNRYGWRLCSFVPGTSGAHSYSGESFPDADTFWAAMRTIVDLAERRPKPQKTIKLEALFWRDRTPGNTYHAVNISVDGVGLHRVTFSYGGDDMYLESAAEWLEANGHIPKRERLNGGKRALGAHCREHGIKLDASYTWTTRKGDLK